jgi:uncharacterized protein with NRDE domain
MCTLVLLHRPGHDWPLLIAANRDEMRTRPWRSPGRHWPDAPAVMAGLDLLSGGSWCGLNDGGRVAAILNRTGSLGPASGKRSRGELVIRALADEGDGIAAVASRDPRAYRSFNMVVADRAGAAWLRHRDEGGRIERFTVPDGLSMFTAHDRNDSAHSPRIRRHLPRFEAAPVPDPERGDWNAWIEILASRAAPDDAEPMAAMTMDLPSGFGTVCSSLVALPRARDRRPLWLFAPGPPDRTPFSAVLL